MPDFDNVLDAQRFNDKKNRERQAQASVYPNDKLRVIATRHQNVMLRNGQILTFYPTKVIDDPYVIDLMDEYEVDYRVVSQAADDSGPKCNFRGCKEPRADDSLMCASHRVIIQEPPDESLCALKGCALKREGDSRLCSMHAAEFAAQPAPIDESLCIIRTCASPKGEDAIVCAEHAHLLTAAPAAEENRGDGASAASGGADWNPKDEDDADPNSTSNE